MYTSHDFAIPSWLEVLPTKRTNINNKSLGT
jgi:hypothetical protein